MTTCADVVAKDAAKSLKPINMLKPDKAAGLAAIWQAGFKELKLTPPNVTGKMLGQFKHLLKAWPDDTAALVAFAVRHWQDFIYAAEKHHGAFSCPDVPNVGFLLKFAHVVVDLRKKALAGPKVEKAPVEVEAFVQSIAPVAKITMAELHKPMTAAEFLAAEAAEEAAEKAAQA